MLQGLNHLWFPDLFTGTVTFSPDVAGTKTIVTVVGMFVSHYLIVKN